MAAQPHPLSEARRRRWLAAEFAALYLAMPLAIAVLLPPRQMFTALLAGTVAGLILLWRTGGFAWRGLWRGRLPWREAALIAVAVAAAGLVLLSLLRPGALLLLLRERPLMLAVICILYPLLSALPQELVFRVLYFHRYAPILPKMPGPALALNAGVFALAHLMYWSPVVTVMTFAGGWLFARAYLRDGLPGAWLLHAVAGDAIFAVGLGVWFYSGNVVRPF